MEEGCGNGFYIFRPDDKVPVEGIKCVPCEIKERQKKMPTRELRKRGIVHTIISVGSTDEADKKLVRCE
jgi:hypothetical protein